MNINSLKSKLEKRASLKKEALVAGVSSYAANAQDKPDEYAKNIAKALATELGADVGGLGGLSGLIGASLYAHRNEPRVKDVVLDKKKLPKKMSKKALGRLLALLGVPLAGYGLGGYGTHKLTKDL